ncbi:hypothetical protein [Cognatilysobacter bugurensis]|uniref:Uncharacterized protein n=1 Tax=Cognatilysobacter bugurensis TaxID=543356 RepID=A0A918T046_9GAMM|nr:hypothetical protein [Lysobacter bugurensis]GHA79684.1 hypothetical protein GCM10007067_16540 [Lysobacter bugurensis]
MSTRSSPNGDTRSGVGRQSNDPRPGGSSAGISPDSNLDSIQAIAGTDEDDLSAGTEDEMQRRQARSTPPMNDVRSDETMQASGRGPL